MIRRETFARHYQQENYVIPCDECKGTRYISREICPKCSGAGRLVIPIPRLSFYKRNPVLSRALILLAAMIVMILVVSLILS